MTLASIQIEIINWAKFNPRKDLKSTSWLRLENTFFTHPGIYELPDKIKLLWLYTLCEASKKQHGAVMLSFNLCLDLLKIPNDECLSGLKQLQALGFIKIPTLRGRHVRGTSTCRPRTTTNERNGRTKRTNEQTPSESSSEVADAPPDPPPMGKVLHFTDWDTKAATWLQKAVVMVNPSARAARKVKLETWADSFRMMREIDKITQEEITEVLVFIFERDPDGFWKTQIQSAPKFRAKWDQLTAHMNNPRHRGGGGGWHK